MLTGNIVIVDDDPALNETLALHFEDQGYVELDRLVRQALNM